MMATKIAVWYGSDEDLKALRAAVVHNCTCVPAEITCAAHSMLADQDVFNHMVFVAGVRHAYMLAEFDPRAEFGLD